MNRLILTLGLLLFVLRGESLLAGETQKNWKKEASLYFLELASLHKIAGNPDASEKSLRKAEALDPKNEKIFYELGQFYLKDRHDISTAIAYFKKYLAQGPESFEKGELRLLLDQLESERLAKMEEVL